MRKFKKYLVVLVLIIALIELAVFISTNNPLYCVDAFAGLICLYLLKNKFYRGYIYQ